MVLKHSYREDDKDAKDGDGNPPWERNLPFMIPPPAYTEESEPFLPNKYFSTTSSSAS